MRFIKELGKGTTKKAFLYDANGEKITILEAVASSKQRSFLWQSRREANITQKLPPMRCDIRTVRVRRVQGGWEVSAHYIEGERLTEALYESLTAREKEGLVADFAEFLLALHSLRVHMTDERYADETDEKGVRYALGALCYKIFCFKKRYFSLKRPWENPYATRRFRREKERLCRRYDFAWAEVKRLEKVVQAVSVRPDIFSLLGVCFGDFVGANFLYDKRTGRLGALDFVCSYKGNIYSEFAGIYAWMGKEFTEELLSRYNELAQEREAHLPECAAQPLKLEFAMVQHLAALELFRKMGKSPEHKESALRLLEELYPDC